MSAMDLILIIDGSIADMNLKVYTKLAAARK
jgi:hypothetical protein